MSQDAYDLPAKTYICTTHTHTHEHKGPSHAEVMDKQWWTEGMCTMYVSNDLHQMLQVGDPKKSSLVTVAHKNAPWG